MKKPIKSVKKPAVKGKGDVDSKKPKLKPMNPKESKNWKNKIEGEDDEDEELELQLEEDEFEELGSSHTYEDNFDEEDDRY